MLPELATNMQPLALCSPLKEILFCDKHILLLVIVCSFASVELDRLFRLLQKLKTTGFSCNALTL